MDYVIVEKGIVGRLVDVHVPSWLRGGVSDHFQVEAKVKVGLGYRGRRKEVQRREFLKASESSKRVID